MAARARRLRVLRTSAWLPSGEPRNESGLEVWARPWIWFPLSPTWDLAEIWDKKKILNFVLLAGLKFVNKSDLKQINLFIFKIKIFCTPLACYYY